ncbi:MAG: DinB family protein [Bacteroidota bacterium]
MKTPSENFSKFEPLVRHWQNELNKYTEEQFLRKPKEDEWSIGQVYMHLFQSAKFLHIKKIEECASQNGNAKTSGKTKRGKIIYALGMLLPVRVKVPPSPQYTPAQPKNKEEAFEKLNQIIVEMKNIIPITECAPLESRTTHPALGYLNAREWYQLIRMHYQHHLRQKSRLDKFLGVQK